MKKILLYLAFIFTFSFTTEAQKETPADYFDRLPKKIISDNSIISSYKIKTDIRDYDLKGNLIRDKSVSGEYTYGLNGDSVRWNNVFVLTTNDLGDKICVKQDVMENLTYIPANVNSDLIDKIHDDNFFLANLVWDVIAIESFAYLCWDSLKLNRPFFAKAIDSEVDLAGKGTFINNEAMITWTGITQINNETCAIIKYSTMNNKVKVETSDVTVDGRSHYWGEIYVSLSDQQIEHATLTEDVITNVSLKGQSNNFLGYTVRQIYVLKSN